MGLMCSTLQRDNRADTEAKRTVDNNGRAAMPVQQGDEPAIVAPDSSNDMEDATRAVSFHDESLKKLGFGPLDATPDSFSGSANAEDKYYAHRQQLVDREQALDFDYRCRARASDREQRVDSILKSLRDHDAANVYQKADSRTGYAGQLHPRFAGDHFLSNVQLINKTSVFDVARRMPKGAHLHIHFNACLPPQVLLDIAKRMDRMFVTSNLPLFSSSDLDKCELQFSILSLEKSASTDSIFSKTYQDRTPMKFAEFLKRFHKHHPGLVVDEWLISKLVFREEEAHDSCQTAAGAWEKFNGRTRMMKGLFNYESAYRTYTRHCLEDFVKDNILYAEIRPNFMTTNQLYHDDGTGPMDNYEIMKILIDEVSAFQSDMEKQSRVFGGLKVIYCTPRSLHPTEVQKALAECLQFKKRWPHWIAGFDLVGEESKGWPLVKFIPELLEFQENCKKAGLDIPFLFHCGETLDMGTSTDGNLVDALLLGCKRIGHGFALAKHPYIMQKMKAQGICLELCPISNEILGLTPRVGGHTMYQLLANNVHCTVSSDNGALFSSTLSHDFYQVLIGKADMGLYGWKQLALWSIEHACLSNPERAAMMKHWEMQWRNFLVWVEDTYGEKTLSP